MSLFARRRGPRVPPLAANSAAVPDTSVAQGAVELHDERLSSRVPSIFFTVDIVGAWHQADDNTHQHRDPAVLARHRLRDCARRTLARYTVIELPAAQDAVNQAIARPPRPVAGLTAYGAAQLT